jgi:hypothetical protein
MKAWDFVNLHEMGEYLLAGGKRKLRSLAVATAWDQEYTSQLVALFEGESSWEPIIFGNRARTQDGAEKALIKAVTEEYDAAIKSPRKGRR